LFCGLHLLEAQRRLAFLDLRAQRVGALRGIRALRPQLVRRDDRDQLIRLDRIALGDHQLADLPADLRADHDIVGRHDAGEHQGHGWARVEVIAGATEGEQDDQGKQFFHVVDSNTCIKQLFHSCQPGAGQGPLGSVADPSPAAV
jgi:hypothetical protein